MCHSPHVFLRDFETKMADRRRRRRNSSHSDSDHSETEEVAPPKVVERKPKTSECASEEGEGEGTSAAEDVSEYESATETNDDEYSEEETTEYDEDSVIVEGSEFDDDSFIEEERQSGDGEEQPEGGDKNLDDDEDQKNPAYIPRKGAFYEHDSRLSAEDGDGGEEKRDLVAKKKLWLDAEKWEHDKYNEGFQTPKSREELVAIYGYDIRASDKPPDTAPRMYNKSRGGRRSESGPSLGDYINDKPQRGGYNNRGGRPDSRGRGGRGGRGGFNRGGRGGGFDPVRMSYRESQQQRGYSDLRNQYQELRLNTNDHRESRNNNDNYNRQQYNNRGRPNDTRPMRGKSSSPEQQYNRNADNRNYHQERRGSSGPPNSYSNGNQGYERKSYSRERDTRENQGPPPRSQVGPPQGDRDQKKPMISRREDDFIPILTTEVVMPTRSQAHYSQAGGQKGPRPTSSDYVPQPKQKSPPFQNPRGQQGGKGDMSREARPKRYSSQRQRPAPESEQPSSSGPGNQGANVPTSAFYPVTASGNSFNPGAPVFQPQSEQGPAPGVAPFPAPPRMRQPQMGAGPYHIPVSSAIQSPPRMYHQGGASVATTTISAPPPIIQSASGAYIAAPVVNYAPPGVVPPGMSGPATFPIVQYTGPQPPIPAPMPPPGSDMQIRGGTTYFPPEAQRVQNVRGGTTYFNPDSQQMREWASPVRRPKQAIQIVSPEESGSGLYEQQYYYEDEEHYVDAEEGVYQDYGTDREDAPTPTPQGGVFSGDAPLPPEFHPRGQYPLPPNIPTEEAEVKSSEISERLSPEQTVPVSEGDDAEEISISADNTSSKSDSAPESEPKSGADRTIETENSQHVSKSEEPAAGAAPPVPQQSSEPPHSSARASEDSTESSPVVENSDPEPQQPEETQPQVDAHPTAEAVPQEQTEPQEDKVVSQPPVETQPPVEPESNVSPVEDKVIEPSPSSEETSSNPTNISTRDEASSTATPSSDSPVDSSVNEVSNSESKAE